MHEKIFVNCDGGSRGNPGPAAIGIVVWDENRNVLEVYKNCIGNATNNVAEYSALIKALKIASEYSKKEVCVFMDSELVVRQMNGQYRVKKDHLLDLYQEVKVAEKVFEKVVYVSVGRNDKYQEVADTLVNQALDYQKP